MDGGGTVIYSVHDPYNGGFAYFEGGPEVAINDDLPTPTYDSSLRTSIGIPASFAARPLPAGVKQIGTGALPVGSMSNGQTGMWRGTAKGKIPSGLGTMDMSAGKLLPIGLLLASGASITYGVKQGEKSWPYLGLSGLCLIAAIWASGRTS